MTALDQALRNPMLAAAIENARHFPVYPVVPKGKRPLHRGWQRSATTEVDCLVRWWAENPNANIGIACRDLVVLDADSKRGEDDVAGLCLPPTTTVRTARGLHFYFVGRARTVKHLFPDVEVKAGPRAGVIGAGSVHPSGREYEWEIAPWEEAGTVPLPALVSDLIDQHRGSSDDGDAFAGGPIRPGYRNNWLTKMAGSLVGRHGVGELAPALRGLNAGWCDPPLPESEVDGIAKSASRWAEPPLWVTDPAAYCSDARLSLGAQRILQVLCAHAKDDGRSRPTVRRIRDLTGASPNTILKLIDELEAKARISVPRRSRVDGNLYKLLEWRPNEGLSLRRTGSSVTDVCNTGRTVPNERVCAAQACGTSNPCLQRARGQNSSISQKGSAS